MSTRNTKASETARAQQLIAGMNKHYSNGPSLTFESATYTPQQIVTGLQTLIALRAAVADARSAVKAKLAAEKEQLPSIEAMMAGLVQFLTLTFSKQPDVLADFGLAQKKTRTPLTVEQKAAAKAKREATRAARGITTKKAKKAVKGDVTGVVVTPVKAVDVVNAPSTAPSTTGTAGGATGGSTSHGA
jgi:hypothetical protein